MALTLCSIYTHFNTCKKKSCRKTLWEKMKLLRWALSPFSTIFSMQSVSQNPLIAKVQLSSAASLNLGLSQNGVLGNGLNKVYMTKSYQNATESVKEDQMACTQADLPLHSMQNIAMVKNSKTIGTINIIPALSFVPRMLPALSKFQFFYHIYFIVCKCFQFG